MNFISMLRLAPGTLLFFIALLAILPAPTHLLWMAAVGVTEGGHWLAIAGLLFAPFVYSPSGMGRVACGLCLAAAVLSLTPLVRARWSDRDVSLLALFRRSSAGLRQTYSYRTVGAEELELDFYAAAKAEPATLIVSIHGGSWNSGDNQDFIPVNRYLADQGYAVADLNYRLAPRSLFPAPSEDVIAAIAFLRGKATELNIRPDRVVLLGRSAGGQIALHVAYTANDPGIRGVISFYAPTDFFWSWENPGSPLILDTHAILSEYLGGTPGDRQEVYTEASPSLVATGKSPPTLLLHGLRDELVSPRHTASLAARLTELGVWHQVVWLPWATHGFDYFPSGPGGQVSRKAIRAFLNSVSGQNRTSR